MLNCGLFSRHYSCLLPACREIARNWKLSSGSWMPSISSSWVAWRARSGSWFCSIHASFQSGGVTPCLLQKIACCVGRIKETISSHHKEPPWTELASCLVLRWWFQFVTLIHVSQHWELEELRLLFGWFEQALELVNILPCSSRDTNLLYGWTKPQQKS